MGCVFVFESEFGSCNEFDVIDVYLRFLLIIHVGCVVVFLCETFNLMNSRNYRFANTLIHREYLQILHCLPESLNTK